MLAQPVRFRSRAAGNEQEARTRRGGQSLDGRDAPPLQWVTPRQECHHQRAGSAEGFESGPLPVLQ